VRRAVDEQGGVPGKWLAARPLYLSRWIRSSTSLLRRKSVTRCRAILCGGREAGDTAHRQL